MILNYYLHDNINIDFDYYFDDTKYYTPPDIILNSDSDKNLSCYILEEGKQRCVVPKNYFDGNVKEYYSLHYLNKVGEKIMVYQLSPFQVILPKENDIIIIILIVNYGYQKMKL